MQKTDQVLKEKAVLPLKELVTECLENYFRQLEGYHPCGVYKMVLNEVEFALFTFVMNYVKGNQLKASELLGMSRSTLRKKLKEHELI